MGVLGLMKGDPMKEERREDALEQINDSESRSTSIDLNSNPRPSSFVSPASQDCDHQNHTEDEANATIEIGAELGFQIEKGSFVQLQVRKLTIAGHELRKCRLPIEAS
ncbi:hypothetical protein L2E82_24936 [Cichorium intybus]|uniref:Uncharacterized protein n=1 Tax=Cichorium intybus TaxID=13427 RepID=A0ACB9E234_CICIN|nr:hypothetical protein L2E82_24936 [Cichorium intybus]